MGCGGTRACLPQCICTCTHAHMVPCFSACTNDLSVRCISRRRSHPSFPLTNPYLSSKFTGEAAKLLGPLGSGERTHLKCLNTYLGQRIKTLSTSSWHLLKPSSSRPGATCTQAPGNTDPSRLTISVCWEEGSFTMHRPFRSKRPQDRQKYTLMHGKPLGKEYRAWGAICRQHGVRSQEHDCHSQPKDRGWTGGKRTPRDPLTARLTSRT